MFQKKSLAVQLLAFFQEEKESILESPSQAMRLMGCFNKSKESLREVGETLTDYFVQKVEGLGAWVFKENPKKRFVQFFGGATRLVLYFIGLLEKLLEYWAEEQFFKICLEKFLFKTILVWKIFFKDISQIRNFLECRHF